MSHVRYSHRGKTEEEGLQTEQLPFYFAAYPVFLDFIGNRAEWLFLGGRLRVTTIGNIIGH